MNRAVWWTCGACGKRQCWRGGGRAECLGCGKVAGFGAGPPAGQRGLDFRAATEAACEREADADDADDVIDAR